MHENYYLALPPRNDQTDNPPLGDRLLLEEQSLVLHRLQPGHVSAGRWPGPGGYDDLRPGVAKNIATVGRWAMP
jgi:hypothetical protein